MPTDGVEMGLESEDTLADSQSEEKTPVEGTETESETTKPEPEIATEWSSLKGNTQERIVQLIREKKALRTALESNRTQATSVTNVEPPQDANLSESEIKDAVGKLSKYGVATKDDLRAIEDRLLLDSEHNRLKGKYPGSDGEPKYVPEEVEEYSRSHYFGGNLDAAFKDMYWDEFVDMEVKKRGKTSTYTEKPTASTRVGDRPLTVESLRERLKQADGAEWWSKNRERIEPLLENLSRK